MTETTENSGIRIRRLKIENYKGIDSLEIEFPPPLMEGDPDVFVIGSKNGGGKTSVLECCALFSIFSDQQKNDSSIHLSGYNTSFPKNIADTLIRAGYKELSIEIQFEKSHAIYDQYLTINTQEYDKKYLSNHFLIESAYEKKLRLELEYQENQIDTSEFQDIDTIFSLPPQKDMSLTQLNRILSISPEPLITPIIIHFNSYRKISHENPKIGDQETSEIISTFKLEVMNIMMGKAALFKDVDSKDSELTLKKLNQLTQYYAEGTIEHLKHISDNQAEILIQPTQGGESYSFDGLSSGQKEMISTLFLIWKNTRNQPAIVLIDEPELHLNAEWHAHFVHQLYELAPQNQYILATHSKHIFGSVYPERRALIRANSDEEWS